MRKSNTEGQIVRKFSKAAEKAEKTDRKRRAGLFLRVSDEPLAEIDHVALETLRFPSCDARNCKRDCCNGAFSKLPLDTKRTYIAKVRQFLREQHSIGKSQQVDAYLRQFIEPPAQRKKRDGASRPPKIHAKFFLPSLESNTQRICTSRAFWQSVFCLSRDKTTALVRSLVSGESMPPEKRGGARFTKAEAKAAVVEALTEKLALAEDHYISFKEKHNLRLQEGVCWADVWKLACKKLDEDFYRRCKSAGYWPGYTKAVRKPSDWPEDLAVPISYWSARSTMRLYNVRKGSRAVDICEDCFQLQKKIQDAATPEAKRAALKKLEAHKKEAEVSMQSRKHDHEAAVGNKYCSVLDVDFAGNFRTPMIPNQEAYYLSIMPMVNLVFATIDRAYYYGYDERVACKGSNEILSLLLRTIKKEKQRLSEEGGKLVHLVLWCDSTRGQTWNTITMRGLHDFVTPGSPFYVEGLERIELKCCVKGHSYMWADRSIVPIKLRAMRTPGGIVASFKNQVPPEFRNRTWEACIDAARMGGRKIIFEQVLQEHILDFKAYYSDPKNVVQPRKCVTFNWLRVVVFSVCSRKLTPLLLFLLFLLGHGRQNDLHFYNNDRTKGDPFKVTAVKLMNFGAVDMSGDSSEGRKATKHEYEVWVRTSHSGKPTWRRIPMLRRGRSTKDIVTAENIDAERKEHNLVIAKAYSGPLPLDVKKKKDLHRLGVIMDGGTGQLQGLYPPLSEAEQGTFAEESKRKRLKKSCMRDQSGAPAATN